MMSSNSFSTDPADDFPEVDDYSEVDALDAIAAELAAELRSNGQVPDAPVEPTAADPTGASAPSPDEQATALAERAGLDLDDDPPIAAGSIELAEPGTADGDDANPVAARAGWFPPVAEHDDGDPGGADHGGSSGLADGADRPPSSPPTDRAPMASEPPAAPTPQADQDGDGTAGQAVDQVAIRKLGGFNFLSIGQWAALPRDERARLLKGGLVIFLFEGEEVPVRPALVWFQQMARSEVIGPADPPTRRRGG